MERASDEPSPSVHSMQAPPHRRAEQSRADKCTHARTHVRSPAPVRTSHYALRTAAHSGLLGLCRTAKPPGAYKERLCSGGTVACLQITFPLRNTYRDTTGRQPHGLLVCTRCSGTTHHPINPMLVSIHTSGMRCNIYGDADGRSVSLRGCGEDHRPR